MYFNNTWNGMTPAFQNSMLTFSTLSLVTGVLVGSQVVDSADNNKDVPAPPVWSERSKIRVEHTCPSLVPLWFPGGCWLL